MIELEDGARRGLEGVFADKRKSPVRIYLGDGYDGVCLALGLDDLAADDSVFEQGGFTFCIDRPLLAQIQGAKVFMTDAGFAVEPLTPLPPMDTKPVRCVTGRGNCNGCGCCDRSYNH